jgi:hypothetical protein
LIAARPAVPSSSVPDDPPAVRPGSRAEKRVDRRPVPVLARPAHHADPPPVDEQVMVGARDVDPAGPDLLAVVGVSRRQRALAGEDARQQARGVLQHVHGDEDRRGEVSGEMPRQLRERLHAPRRRPDDDDIMTAHDDLRDAVAPDTPTAGIRKRGRGGPIGRREEPVNSPTRRHGTRPGPANIWL